MNEAKNIKVLQYPLSGVGGIAVVADDFTGAAELAGIALRYGLKVGLYTGNVEDVEVDVVVVSTDSRSLSTEEAVAVTKKTVEQFMQLNPQFIYKKTDSVLRGYVVDELKAQMQLQGLDKALYLPANPSLNRKIVDGHYYVNDVLISETNFAADPEFSIKHSLVKSILKDEVEVLKHEDELPENGIIVGEVADEKDIEQWIDKVDDSFLLAGAGDFFDKLLQRSFSKQTEADELHLLQPHLYICGTSFTKSVEFVKSIDTELVHYLSSKLLTNESDDAWFISIAASLDKHQKAVLAFDDELIKSLSLSALQLRTIMASVAKQIIQQNSIKEVLIEGGSTAAAILQELNINSFIPTHEPSRGVIRMKADCSLSFGEGWGEVFITVKPGSYELSSIIKRLYNT